MATTTPIRSIAKTIDTPMPANLIVLDDGVSMGKAELGASVEAVANPLVDEKIAALDLGTASKEDAGAFATATQGGKADTAVQPDDLSPVATSGEYDDLSSKPTLGTAAAKDVGTVAGKVAAGDDIRFLTPAAMPNLGAYGAVGNDVADDKNPLQNAVTWAYADSRRRRLVITGRHYSSGDIANLHAVQFEGTGSIRIGSGGEYFPRANRLNRGYGGLGYNDLFVDPVLGSDTNSGIAPEYPFKSLQRAVDILASKGSPVPGYWRIYLAKGVYQAGCNTTYVQTLRGVPIEIHGPAVDAWDNSNPPPEPLTITAITSANPPVVTTGAAHGMSNGDQVFIGLATKSGGGAHASDGAIYTVANVTSTTFELSGVNGAAWTAYTASSGKAYPLLGSRPKAIFYGSGSGSGSAFTLDGQVTLFAYDLLGVNWGTKVGAGDESLIRAMGGYPRTYNCHAHDCSKGIEFRDGAVGQAIGGLISDCYVSYRVIHARYTIGAANPGSAALTTTPISRRASIGVDIWEGGDGHVDGMIFEDCNGSISVGKGGYAVALYNRYKNSGAAKTGLTIYGGGKMLIDPGSDIWTGSYKPLIDRRDGASLMILGETSRRTWDTVAAGQPPAITGGAGQVTVGSYNILASQMMAAPQKLRAKLALDLPATTGTVTARFKFGSSNYLSQAFAPSSNARTVLIEFEAAANGFGTVRQLSRVTETDTVAGTTAVSHRGGSNSLDTTAGNVLFSISLQSTIENISANGMFEIEALGW